MMLIVQAMARKRRENREALGRFVLVVLENMTENFTILNFNFYPEFTED